MIHLDFEWDIRQDGIILDPALNLDKLGWQGGDYFKLVNVNGQAKLVKLDSVEMFFAGKAVNKE